MNITSADQAIRAVELRNLAGAPLMRCVDALKANDWDLQRAATWLRNRPSFEQRIAVLEQQVKALQLATSRLVD